MAASGDNQWEPTLDDFGEHESWEPNLDDFGEHESWEPNLDDFRQDAFNEMGVVDERGPAKRYQTLDAPLREWVGQRDRRGYREEYLDEELRLDSRETAPLDPCSCGGNEHLFRCTDCFGVTMLCQLCCVANHKQLPLHKIQKWNGNFFQCTTLKEMGLMVQLGHDCYCPECGHHPPHEYQLLWLQGLHSPLSATFMVWLVSFYGSQPEDSLYKNSTGPFSTSHLRKQVLSYVIRQFQHIKLLKRGGRGNVLNGISTTKSGKLAVICPACLQPGINLPGDWQNVEPSKRFLYFLTLTLDANFHLKNQNHLSEAADPGLHTRLAYFIPSKPYRDHILKYTMQEDISTCSGFKSLAHAETKFSTGLRATGVGLCLCVWHELVCPHGVGDLQKGEQPPGAFTTSSRGRNVIFPLQDPEISCALPIQLPVQYLTHSILFLELDVPMERELNVIGQKSTMWQIALRKWDLDQDTTASTIILVTTTGESALLCRRYIAAVSEHNHHQSALAEFNLAVDVSHWEQWTMMIETWDAAKSKPNPYLATTTFLNEAEVRAQFANEEKEALAKGLLSHHKTSPSSFVAQGLALEETQRRLSSDVRDVTALTPIQHADLERWNCMANIATIEEWLREAKSHFIKYHNSHIRGQRANMRAHTLSESLSSKVNHVAEKYCACGSANCKFFMQRTFVVPTATTLGDINDTNDPINSSGCQRSKKQQEGLRRGLGEGHRTISWIWKTAGVMGDNKGLNKARAQAACWTEEVELLKEEMRRTRKFFQWKANWWEQRLELPGDYRADPIHAEGIAAYVKRQAAVQHKLFLHFTSLWEVPAQDMSNAEVDNGEMGNPSDAWVDPESSAYEGDKDEDDYMDDR
ncbi:hypothetical protein BDN67DRAFT_982178 [Paxillus ammoniavirescens]|nr:hypothetical protein BDN67DRAFT_982178 [Paxillus ammoniavirescens]